MVTGPSTRLGPLRMTTTAGRSGTAASLRSHAVTASGQPAAWPAAAISARSAMDIGSFGACERAGGTERHRTPRCRSAPCRGRCAPRAGPEKRGTCATLPAASRRARATRRAWSRPWRAGKRFGPRVPPTAPESAAPVRPCPAGLAGGGTIGYFPSRKILSWREHNDRIEQADAARALSEIGRRREQVIRRRVIPGWFWWARPCWWSRSRRPSSPGAAWSSGSGSPCSWPARSSSTVPVVPRGPRRPLRRGLAGPGRPPGTGRAGRLSGRPARRAAGRPRSA